MTDLQEAMSWHARIHAASALPATAPSGWQTRLSVVVTCYERPACIAHFLSAARAAYPNLPIVVSDASAVPMFTHDTALGERIRWVVLPKSRGHTVGASRNYALLHVATPLFFLCDDDHVLGAHTDLARMVACIDAHGLDIVGGCQGRDDYGAAVFVARGAHVEQRFYCHHGLVAQGLVRCDRVSNTFVARTERIRSVGWEERVYGDEHAEFFWRAKIAGLQVAQLAGTWVRHERQRETASHAWSRWLKPFLSHPDRDYLRKRMGGDKAVAKSAHARFCLEKNQIAAMVSRTRWRDKRAFMRLMRG